ncbi:MAG: chemotaxis protein CheB [Pseudomonadota bacterium]
MATSASSGMTESTLASTNPKSSLRRANSVPPIVGIGASAGGLEALEHFLQNVPEQSGIAFVIVQHLDPTYKGMLPELLQRATKMVVSQASNRVKVRPNCVYIIPPNKDLSILHGVLHLLEPAAARGMRLPIDFFLRALADDQREQAIGVILSGMGSDGTLGLRAIKEKAGLTLVQDPATAKFDPMPRSAIDAGLADVVAKVEDLPATICAYLQRVHSGRRPLPVLQPESRNALEQIVILLRERTGNDFSHYKKQSIHRRIERRMGLHQIDKLVNYVRYLRENPQELDLLFKELLIGVTNFFRDAVVWDFLKNDAIPAILKAHQGGKLLRAWVPGCSTGEEAYSLAMCFKEALEQVKPKARFSLQIFATDLDRDAIDKARQGLYPLNIAADVTPERLGRFFIAEENGYRVSKEIREMIVFAPHNIIMDPPFTKLDILTCRNLLIYFDSELQNRLMPLFHYALYREGILVLGSAETVGAHTALFATLDSKTRVYQRLETRSTPALDFPTKNFPIISTPLEESKVANPSENFQSQADQFLLQNLSPAAVLVNPEGDIIYINGRTGKFLEPAAGKANLNIYAMAREGLRYALASALNKVVRNQGAVFLEGLQVSDGKGDPYSVNLTVQVIDKPSPLQGMIMIAFNEVATPASDHMAQPDVDGSQNAELTLARQEVQSIREEMQTAQEELTTTNEELQSTNEELQSTNEELTTSKEEMQSLNEELQSVNAELQSKVDDLSWINSDMKNLLNSTDIATIFLDDDLHVRRYTEMATHIFNLIPGDVGRPLSDITNVLQYAQLQDDAREVLRTLIFSEKQIEASNRRWFRVRIMPYRTLENVIDGVVITFSDISAFKQLEVQLRSKNLESPEPRLK